MGCANAITRVGPTVVIAVFGGWFGKDCSERVTIWSSGKTFGAIVTLLPSGRIMVPPEAAEIDCVTLAMVPAITTGTEADFELSATLVAAIFTVNGVGKLAGAR